MVYIRNMILVFLTTTLLATYSLAETNVYETLTFNEFHDPGWMKLTRPNGEQVTANFFYSLIEFEDIDEWKEGEAIEVTVSDSEGVLIRRIKTDKTYIVVFSEQYPIDQLLDECLSSDMSTTIQIAGCHGQASYYWDAYSDTLQQSLLSMNNSDFADALIKESEAWNVYKESRSTAIRSYMDQDEWRGTIQTIINAVDSRLESQYRFSTLVRYFE